MPDFDLFHYIKNFLGISPAKKKFQVPNWDYCELLIRTLATKFMMHSWSTQSFFDSLKNQEAFYRTIAYLSSIKKGIKFLYRLKNDVHYNRVHISQFQADAILNLSL
jgi:hypothetical protein